MAKPDNYSAWRSYKTSLGDVPVHTGTKFEYGPFIVTGKTDLRDPDFIPAGGIAILGKGWNGWNDVDADQTPPTAITKPTGFAWGVIIKQVSGANITYILKYCRENNATVTTVATSSLALSSSTGRYTGDIVFDQSITGQQGGGSNDLYSAAKLVKDPFKNKFYVFTTADSGGDGPTTSSPKKLFLAWNSSRSDAYDIEQTDTNKVSLIRYYHSAGNSEYFRVRKWADANDDDAEQANEYTIAERYDAGGEIVRGDTIPAVNADGHNIADGVAKHIYLEDTRYDDEGNIYRSVSESVPIETVIGGGEVWLNLKYWGNSPSGRPPYSIKVVRIISSTKARDAFWTC